MALVPYRTAYYDTDDLDDLSYHYYRRAEKLELYDLKRKLLTGKLTGDEIEANPGKYKDIL